MVGRQFSSSFNTNIDYRRNKSAEVIQKSVIERCLTKSLYQVYLRIPLFREKVFIIHSLLVAQKCSKHFPFLLMTESLCLPITPFHVLSSVQTCALKSPSTTINSADVTFSKATLRYLRKTGTVFQRLVRAPAKMHSDRSSKLSVRRQALSLSGIQSVTQWAK